MADVSREDLITAAGGLANAHSLVLVRLIRELHDKSLVDKNAMAAEIQKAADEVAAAHRGRFDAFVLGHIAGMLRDPDPHSWKPVVIPGGRTDNRS